MAGGVGPADCKTSTSGRLVLCSASNERSGSHPMQAAAEVTVPSSLLSVDRAGAAAASPPPVDPLADLNDAQRAAVLHGAGRPAGPLLVIAGAGSGKTNTLACRVARLVADGADPHRILLLTFSRRAARAMEQRAGRMLHRLCGTAQGTAAPTLPWAGTFHSVAARLLREYAPRIGLPESFTIHDRPDSEDLLAIVRHARGLASTERRFPGKGTCLAIY